MAVALSLDDVATHAGERPEFVERCHDLGLVGIGDPPRFDAADVVRVRLLRTLTVHGLDLEAVAAVEGEQGLLNLALSQMSPSGEWPSIPLGDVVSPLDLPADVVERLGSVAGLDDQGGLVTTDDVAMLHGAKVALDAGLPPDALTQMVTVYADALGRVADAEMRLFHFYVHARLRAEGLRGQELVERTMASGERLGALMEPAILYFHRKGIARVAREDAVLHFTVETGAAAAPQATGQLPVAVVFVDLSDFTALTDAMGDVSAARVLKRFSELIRPSVGRHGGRVIKQIGDEFMVVFSRPQAAVAFALDAKQRAAHETEFSGTRTGVHWGTVLYREGDYYGATVNLAARVAGAAECHQVLVTDQVRAAVGDERVQFRSLGHRRLKGIGDIVELFEVRDEAEQPAGLVRDAVCGMEMQPDSVTAKLELDGREFAFCSTSCLQRFSSNPERYSRPHA